MTATLTVGDTAPTLTGTVNNNITGATLALHVQRPDATVFTRTASIVNGAAGTWSAQLQSGDLTLAGAYLTELQVTYSDSTVQSFALDDRGGVTYFKVRNQMA